MIEKLKNIKLHVTFSALMSIIIGILLVIYKAGFIAMIFVLNLYCLQRFEAGNLDLLSKDVFCN